MYYCKDFYSLAVLSLYEGELLGKVDKLCFDKQIKKLIELELVGEDGAKLVLPTKNIYHVGKNAITVKNNQAVMMKREETNLCVAPINSKAYSITGEFLGIVQEISLDDKFLTQKLSLENNGVLDVKYIASCGKNTIVFYDSDNRVNIKKFNPKPFENLKIKENQTVNVLPVEEENSNVVPVETKKQTTDINTSFLLGRVCTKDIFNFNNELLIKAHALVNKKNLKEINKFGKLRELMLYLK